MRAHQDRLAEKAEPLADRGRDRRRGARAPGCFARFLERVHERRPVDRLGVRQRDPCEAEVVLDGRARSNRRA